jgi:hypothetical protein
MLLRILLLGALSLLGMPIGPAVADDADPPKWGEAGSWDIFVDPNHGNRCYATSGALGVAMLISIRPDGDLDWRGWLWSPLSSSGRR